MRRTFSVSVPGKPVPKGSRVSGVTKTGVRFNRESNPAVAPYMRRLEKAFRDELGDEGELSPPYAVDVVFYFDAPRTPTWPRSSDADKLLRSVGDSLTKAGVISDDRHIVEISGRKAYGEPGTVVRVRELDEWTD
jgi:Holliday junction resolvase RusA-like endonuclease